MALWKPWKEILWPFPRRGRIQTVWCTLFSNMSCTASVGRTTFVINLLITHTRMFSGNNLKKVLIESNIHDKPFKKKYISRKSSKKFTLLLISDYWGAGDLGQNGDNQYYAVIGCWSSELMHIVQWTDSSSNTFLSHFFYMSSHLERLDMLEEPNLSSFNLLWFSVKALPGFNFQTNYSDI